MKSHRFKTVIAIIFIGLLFTSLSAQNLLFQSIPKKKPQFGLRFMRPNFKSNFFWWNDLSLSILSGSYDFYFNIPVSFKLNVVGSLPYSVFSAKDEESEGGIGSIYVGIQTRPTSGSTSSSSLQMGIFLPTATDESFPVVLGLYSNYYEFQKYISDLLTVYGNFSYSMTHPRGAIFGIEIGPNLFIPTKDDVFEDDAELFAHYGIFGGFKLTSVTFSAELEGLAIISEDVDDFEDRFVHSVAFGAQWTGSNIKPGVYYQIYLKENLRDIVDGVLGIKVDVDIK